MAKQSKIHEQVVISCLPSPAFSCVFGNDRSPRRPDRLLLVSLVLAVGFGHAAIAPSETLRFLGAGVLGGTVTENELTPYTVVWEIRAPRAVLAALLGAGLAVTGVVMQVLVRNALADPFILGISLGRRLTFAPFSARLHGRPQRYIAR